MSFTFGQSTTTTTGPTFGTNTLSGGTLFGAGDSKPFQSSTGTENKVNFFNTPTTTTPAFGSIAFGAKTTAATSSFFSSPTTTTAYQAFSGSKPLAFSGFTSPPNQTVGSPGFGQPAAIQNAPQNLSFGPTPTVPTQAASAFGTPTTQAAPFAPPANSSFSFPKPGATSGFAFTSASSFSVPQQPVATSSQPIQSSFSITPVTTAVGSASFPQSAPAFSSMFAKSSFSLTPTTATGTTVAATSSAAPSFAAPGTASFSLGQQSSGFGVNQTQPTTTVSSGFSFNQGQTTTSFASSQPQVTQAQATLSFATTTPTTIQQTTPSLNFAGTVLPKPSAAGPVSQVGLNQSTALTGFTVTSTTAQTPKLGFGATTSTITGQASTPATSALSFSTVTGGPLFSGPAVAGPPKLGLAFGKTSTTTTTSGTTTSAATGILSLSKSTAASAMPTLTTTTTTTAATSGPPQAIASITFTQLEENINKWTLELEEQEKIFINQATQINAWDRLLIANGEMIVELNDTIQTVKNDQQSLEHELDFVLAQQKELEEILTPMEKQLLNETGDRLRDPEREHMYSLAENLDSQLRQMSEDLKEVIEHLNETNRSQDTNDPIVQIGRILNAHMSSMQWIDNSIAQISTKLDQLKATHDTLRRDNERSFQLTYN